MKQNTQNVKYIKMGIHKHNTKKHIIYKTKQKHTKHVIYTKIQNRTKRI